MVWTISALQQLSPGAARDGASGRSIRARARLETSDECPLSAGFRPGTSVEHELQSAIQLEPEFDQHTGCERTGATHTPCAVHEHAIPLSQRRSDFVRQVGKGREVVGNTKIGNGTGPYRPRQGPEPRSPWHTWAPSLGSPKAARGRRRCRYDTGPTPSTLPQAVRIVRACCGDRAGQQLRREVQRFGTSKTLYRCVGTVELAETALLGRER